MPVNTPVDVMVNGNRPLVVAAVLVDPVTGATTGTSTPMAVVPMLTSCGHLAVTTSATSGTYVAFASQACKQLTIVNNTGTTLEVQQGGSGIAIAIFPGLPFTLFGLTNTNTVGIRRVDLSTTQVTVQARWEA